jgi:CBS domain-containing protein
MLAKDVMTSAVITVAPQTPVPEVANLLLARAISAAPVVDAAGRVLGIVSEGDLINRVDGGGRRRGSWWLELVRPAEEQARDFLKLHGQRAEDVMTREVISVTEDTPLAEIARLLEKHRVKRVPVLRDGRLVGIVSRANLLHGLAHAPRAQPVAQTDREVREALLKALAAAGLPMHQLNITVKDGVAALWGWVDAEVQREAARAAAEETPGVERVQNELNVMSPAARAGRGFV